MMSLNMFVGTFLFASDEHGSAGVVCNVLCLCSFCQNLNLVSRRRRQYSVSYCSCPMDYFRLRCSYTGMQSSNNRASATERTQPTQAMTTTTGTIRYHRPRKRQCKRAWRMRVADGGCNDYFPSSPAIFNTTGNCQNRINFYELYIVHTTYQPITGLQNIKIIQKHNSTRQLQSAMTTQRHTGLHCASYCGS